MKTLFIILLVCLFSCKEEKYSHSIYGDFSLGITKDSLDKIHNYEVEKGLLLPSNVSQGGKNMPYLKSSQLSNGKTFNLYPSFYFTNNLVVEALFYISDSNETWDQIKDAKAHLISTFPLKSNQDVEDNNLNIAGFEDIEESIINKLSSNYGNNYVLDSSRSDEFGKSVLKKEYTWKNIDGMMGINYVIWATNPFCHTCSNPLLGSYPHEHKYYRESRMYFEYLLNGEVIKRIKKNSKNEF